MKNDNVKWKWIKYEMNKMKWMNKIIMIIIIMKKWK